jgi:hypothetical protein
VKRGIHKKTTTKNKQNKQNNKKQQSQTNKRKKEEKRIQPTKQTNMSYFSTTHQNTCRNSSTMSITREAQIGFINLSKKQLRISNSTYDG